MNLLVKLKKYFNGIGMVKRTLIMTVFALFVSINFNTVLTHAEVLYFSDTDLDGTKTSITRDIGGGKVTFSGDTNLRYMPNNPNGGLFADDGLSDSVGVKLTISEVNGYIFDIDSFKAKADYGTVKIEMTYADDRTTTLEPDGISSTELSALSPTIKNVKKVVLSSGMPAIFQDFDIVNVRQIPAIPNVDRCVSDITATTATLNAKVTDTGGDDTTVYFEYGTNSSLGKRSPDFKVTSDSSGTNVPFIMSGLSPGSRYYYKVVAHNAGGATNFGYNSFDILPGAPTIGTVTAGDTQAEVSFTTAPDPKVGAIITEYTVTAKPKAGGDSITAKGKASPITVTGLTNGTAYTFTVTATNSAGTGAASDPL